MLTIAMLILSAKSKANIEGGFFLLIADIIITYLICKTAIEVATILSA